MKTIRCQNRVINRKTGEPGFRCGHVLAVLTDLQVEMLRVDEEQPIFRCPSCPPDMRWTRLKWGIDGVVLEPVEEMNDKLPNEPNYESVEIYSQVG